MAALIALLVIASHAAGTIEFRNGSFTRYRWFSGATPQPVVFGVFWGTNQSGLDQTLALPLGTGSVSSAGIILAPSIYPIPGTEAGQVVYMQIRAWATSYGTDWMAARQQFAAYGETDVRQVLLGPEAGPGTVIWQAVGGTNPDRFYPIELGRPLTPYNVIGFGTSTGYMDSVIVYEGNQGSVSVGIPVMRSGSVIPGFPSLGLGENVAVLLSTSNLTALAGQDYVAANFAVRFGGGETALHIPIELISDPLSEGDEQFSVHLSDAGNFVVINPTPLVVTIREMRILSLRRSGGLAVITLRTAVGRRYALQVSSDLVSWSTVIGGSIVGNGSAMEITDPFSACCEQRFYRVELVPPPI